MTTVKALSVQVCFFGDGFHTSISFCYVTEALRNVAERDVKLLEHGTPTSPVLQPPIQHFGNDLFFHRF